jgi:hypothetical protein
MPHTLNSEKNKYPKRASFEIKSRRLEIGKSSQISAYGIYALKRNSQAKAKKP